MVGVLQTPAVKSPSSMCCCSALLCQVTGVWGVALVLSRICPVWLSPTQWGVKTDESHLPQREVSALQAPTEIKTMGESHCEIVRCQLEMPLHSGSGNLPSGVEGLCPSLSQQKQIPGPEVSPGTVHAKIWLDLTQIHCQCLCKKLLTKEASVGGKFSFFSFFGIPNRLK